MRILSAISPTGLETCETAIKVTEVPHPHPKPGRYAFRFPTFTGTIDKPNERTGPTLPRAPR